MSVGTTEDGMENFRRILVVSRMTPYCQEAVRYGVSLARKFDAKLQVLHLVPNPAVAVIELINVPGLLLSEEYQNYIDIQREAKEELDKIIQQERSNDFSIKELISDNDPVKEIIKVANDNRIDLIVMIAHEEGRIEHKLFGGEKDAVLRSLPCSILLVKMEKPEPVG